MQLNLLNRNVLVRIMKMSGLQVLLALVLVNMSWAFDGKAQELLARRVSISVQNQDLEVVVKQLEKVASVQFLFSREIVQSKRKVSYQARHEQLGHVLEEILTPMNVRYEVVGQQIVLKKNSSSTQIQPNVPDTEPQVETSADIRISGTVTTAEGEKLPGVNVVIKGTTRGTTTNVKGEYDINVPDNNAVLIFSYLGFVSQEIPVANRQSLNVVMAVDSKTLQEAVVIGYGTVSRRNVTSSIASVDTRDLNKTTAPNVAQLLAGRVPGLTAMQTTGQPGAGASVQIRSVPSPNAAANVLYVVDGIIINDNSTDVDASTRYGGSGVSRSSLNFINPNDIESVEVLKDASALAIYGSRAAGGAIIITTRRGKEGKPKVEYSVSHAGQKAIDFYDTFDTKEYMEQRNALLYERWLYTNKIAPYGTTEPGKAPAFKPRFSDADIAGTPNYPNALDAILRSGSTQQHNLSISGGNGKTSYYISGNYFNQTGVVKNTDYVRYNGRVNLDQKFSDTFKVGINLTLNNSSANNGNVQTGVFENAGIIGAAFNFPPYLPFTDKDGNYIINPDYGATPNPISYLDVTDITRSRRLLTNTYAEWNFLPGFTAKVNVGYDQSNAKRDSYLPKTFLPGKQVGGQASVNYQQTDMKTLEYTLGYVKNLGEKHQINAVAGYSYNQTDAEGLGAYNENFLSDNTLYNDLSQGAAIRPGVGSGRSQRLYASYFARAIYTFNNRYIVSLVGRRDGYSLFAKNKKWGFFPGASAAWIVSDEPFMAAMPQVSFLKLRAGYGVIGNNNIGTSGFGFYAIGNNFTFGGVQANGAYLSQLQNDDLTWEKNTEINLGLDLKVLQNRIGLSFDYFNRTISDLLNSRQLPTDYIIGSVAANVGKTRSRGWEVGLTTQNTVSRDNKGLTWSTTLNLSRYFNTWLERDPRTLATLPKYINPQGPYDAIFGYRHDGILQVGDAIPEHMKGAFVGLLKIKDLNGYGTDGNLTGKPDGKLSDADMTLIGNSAPRLSYGFNNTFTYRNFDLSIYMYGLLQTKQNNDLRYAFDMDVPFGSFGWNPLAVTRERWSHKNPSTKYPSGLASPFNAYATNSDFWFEDASFLRCRDITLGYNLTGSLLKNQKVVSGLRVSLNLQNPFILTRYTGMDPELQNFLAYPMTRSVTLGLNATF